MAPSARRHHSRASAGQPAPAVVGRPALVALSVAVAFAVVGGQLVRLAMRGQNEPATTMSQAVPTSVARPDIVDRNGRLLATDLEVPSLYADPALVLDRDEVAEKLARVVPGLDEAETRRLLSDRSRRFVWLRRGLSPKVAQAVHDLGLPGVAFRRELRRAYPAGRLAGHLIGTVNVDNRGQSGLERHLDDAGLVEPVHGATRTDRAPLRTALDLGAQHALDEELRAAVDRYRAKAAAGIVLDAATGEIVAAQSVPDADPARPLEFTDDGRPDRVTGGVYELGSIFKLMTVAMALDGGEVRRDSVLDVRVPLEVGRFTIRDPHPAGRPLTVEEIFVRSSNVGAGMLALAAGVDRQKAFLDRLGLLSPIRTEAGPVSPPLLPAAQGAAPWGRIETVTIAYGHGLALAPIQFAASAAGLLNGGHRVTPTLLRRLSGDATPSGRVVSAATSSTLRDLMRRNVTDRAGTGRRADAPGYRVGGKTGTAELAARGGYRETAVVSSFLGAFPMDAPRFVTLVTLFEPSPTADAGGQVAAGSNAAPTTARLVARIAPLLGVLPDGAAAPLDDGGEASHQAFDGAFDGTGGAKY